MYFLASANQDSTLMPVKDTSQTRIQISFADSCYVLLPTDLAKALRGTVQLETNVDVTGKIHGILEESSIW